MKIMAHRGSSGDFPENTIAAFHKAVEEKSDSIELDVRLSKDGVLVVCHDATIKRTSDGNGHISDLTLEELKKYDFGSWKSEEFKGEQIPTLEEVLISLKDTDLLLNIEIKNGPIIQKGIEEKLLKMINKYGYNDRVMVSSFDHLSLKRLYDLDQNIKIGLIFHINLINLFEYIKNTGIKPYSIHPNHFYITKDMIEEAHRQDIKVFAYTIDDVSLGNKYKDKGVDGIITNRPLGFR